MVESEGGAEKLAEVLDWRDIKLFSPMERLALEYAERITTPQIVELTAAIAMENFRSKFNPPLGIEAQGFCMVPKRSAAD